MVAGVVFGDLMMNKTRLRRIFSLLVRSRWFFDLSVFAKVIARLTFKTICDIIKGYVLFNIPFECFWAVKCEIAV